MQRYQQASFFRKEPPYKNLASFGKTRLLVHEQAITKQSKAVVLVVPSLINRYEVADLLPDLSLMRALQERDFMPILIDWGNPDQELQRSDLAFYTKRLEEICIYVQQNFSSPFLVSHCLGGLLSLGVGLINRAPVKGMVFIALPWDFSQTHSEWGLISSPMHLRHDMIRDHFLWQHAVMNMERFRKFAVHSPKNQQQEEFTISDRSFIAIEDWLSSGYDMSAGLSADLRALCGKKLSRHKLWWLEKTQAQSLSEKIRCPSTVFLPLHDKIVPPYRTVEAVKCMENVRTIPIRTGHLGLIAGRHIPKAVKALEDTYERLRL